MRHALLLMAAMFMVGCTQYEYSIIAPPNLARTIPRGSDTIVGVDPFEYRMQTVDNRLVMRIFNPTNETFQLLGERSSVVDPQGQSRPLRGGPIAPYSFFKLIIPPPRPEVWSSGPTWGVGMGVGIGEVDPRSRRSVGFNDPIYTEPQYATVIDASDPRFWEWSGEGGARLTLIYQRGGSDKLIQHEFTFQRHKL